MCCSLCDTNIYAKGFCRKHYQRNWRRGNPEVLLGTLADTPLLDRFWKKVVKGRRCWLWVGAKTSRDYGLFWTGKDGKTVLAHRWIYRQVVGPIPSGMELDHLCSVRLCVRPDHLEPVTREVNIRRAVERRQRLKKRRLVRRTSSLSGSSG